MIMLVMGKLTMEAGFFITFPTHRGPLRYGVVNCGQLVAFNNSAQSEVKSHIMWGAALLVTGVMGWIFLGITPK